MGKWLDPGPPLVPENEFCASEPPSSRDYAKAAGISLLLLVGGATAWLLVVLATRRLWGFPAVLIGIGTGWALHATAGQHRSIALGVMAAATTALATAGGYGLLWLPFIDPKAMSRAFSWYDLLMVAAGAFVAYRLAGPKPKPPDPT